MPGRDFPPPRNPFDAAAPRAYAAAVSKIAFTVGGLAIYWYGILVAAGFLVGLWTASRRAPQALSLIHI